MIQAKATIVELDMGELEEILRRIEAKELRADDYDKIRALIESYVSLFLAVGDKNTTIRRLRQMLFGAKTEKTSTVLGRHSKDRRGSEKESAASSASGDPASSGEGGDAKAASETNAAAEAPSDSPTPSRGHGRNGAADYTGAEKVNVPHPSLVPGDPCPACEKGTVYEANRPGVLIRLGTPTNAP